MPVGLLVVKANNYHLGDVQVKTSDSIVKIIAPTRKVWLALTVPDLVKQWQYRL